MSTLKTLTINGTTYSVVPVVPAASVTLLASGWVGSEGAYSQVVGLVGVTSHTKVDLQPTPEQVETFLAQTLAFVAENDNGVVTVYSIGDKPQDDYTIQVTMTEVEGAPPIRGDTVGLPNPQADWDQTDSTQADYIKNKPNALDGYSVLYLTGDAIDNSVQTELIEKLDGYRIKPGDMLIGYDGWLFRITSEVYLDGDVELVNVEALGLLKGADGSAGADGVGIQSIYITEV